MTGAQVAHIGAEGIIARAYRRLGTVVDLAVRVVDAPRTGWLGELVRYELEGVNVDCCLYEDQAVRLSFHLILIYYQTPT